MSCSGLTGADGCNNDDIDDDDDIDEVGIKERVGERVHTVVPPTAIQPY